jgi:hypothetical protein
VATLEEVFSLFGMVISAGRHCRRS